MNEFPYAGDFAGKQLHFSFRHADTAAWYGGWLSSSEPVPDPIRVSPEDCEIWIRDYGMADDAACEFGMSVYRASERLLRYDACAFHAAAMLWRGKAWLFAADSGTGKSTQLWRWQALYGDEIRIMNGDKPILRREADGSVTVCPSPWKGKEEWGDDSLSAPLGGVILLKQGKENTITACPAFQCIARLLSYFFSLFDTPETVSALCRMEEAILRAVPVYQLVNLGDEASARLTHDTILQKEAEANASA